jgi:hypothetical protein
MTLSIYASHPHTHTYVLKLHRDAAPQLGCIVGRLEHLDSGEHFDFASAEELIACLVRASVLLENDS